MNGLEAVRDWILNEIKEDAKKGDKVSLYFVKGIKEDNQEVLKELAGYIADMFVKLSK